MSIFLSSAEASGDHYAACLTKALRRNGYNDNIWGMGAAESEKAGLRIEWRGERLQIMGVTEAISSIPFVLRLLNETARRVIETKPEAVVAADGPDYHMRLIAKLRSMGYGGKIFYISPPTVWAWRSGRMKQLKKYVDECFPLYEFEHRFLSEHGCRSYWTGAPLLEEFSRDEARVPKELAGDDKIIAFMPGSRAGEVTSLLPAMKASARRLAGLGWHPVFSVAPGLAQNVRGQMADDFRADGMAYYDGAGRDLLAAARCSVSASGTICVESMLLRKFMTVVYKLSPVSAFLAKHLIRLKYFSMANILAGREMFPELMQRDCTAENMTAKTLSWLESGEAAQAAAVAEMERTSALLGVPGVYGHWAERIMANIQC